MKAHLVFDQEDDLLDAINGYKFRLALVDLDQFLRNEMKHNDNLTEDQYNYAYILRNKLHEFIHNYNVNLE